MGEVEQSINLELLIREFSNESESAFEELFDYYYKRLYNFSRSFLKTGEGIDDILQDVFIKIWQQRKNIHNPETFNSLLYTITRNLLLNEIRRRLNNEKKREEIRNMSLASEYETTIEVDYSLLKENVDQIIENLPDRKKEIFKLSREEGLSYKEIAEKLNISTKNVEYHISQVLSVLRKGLKSQGWSALLFFHFFI